MKIEHHADNTEELCGYRAEDIHEWIDQYFDHKRFREPLWRWVVDRWNPYNHRKHLHHIDALPKAVEAFKDKYPEEIIEKVFVQHLKDDYGGYVPTRNDFDDPAFIKKYHRLFF